MKILYFHQHFGTPKQAGGTRSYEFAQHLIKRGHAVTMVCGKTTDLELSKSKYKNINSGNIDGIDVIQIDIPYSNNDGILKRTWVFIKFAWKGIKIALKEDYDLLFATSTPLTAGIPGIVMKWFGRKKTFVFEVRDLWPELPKALGLKNPFLLWGMNVLEKLTYRKADACIGLSPGICEGIKRRSAKGKNVVMIPNGCDLDIFQPEKREDLRLEGINSTDIVAVFTGAHGVANGLNAVLDTAHELKKLNRTDIKLVFIGNGKIKPALVERAKHERLDNCLFYDPMPKVKLNQIVSRADIGMMVLANIPAFYYGTSPNKFFDYIASGLPVINNYPGWLADMIQENDLGMVVAPNDPKVFAEGLVKLADNPQQRKMQGVNARKLAETTFSRNMLGSQFVEFLEESYKNKKYKSYSY